MKHHFSIIINVLILILIVVLVCVMFNYYANGRVEVSNPKTPVTQQPTSVPTGPKEQLTPTREPFIEITPEHIENNNNEVIENSGEEQNTVEISITSPTKIPEDVSNIPEKNTTAENNQTSSPVMISSETETSSKEKREILGELDKTLMELLDVVDKVTIVDESRLPSDSEVEI